MQKLNAKLKILKRTIMTLCVIPVQTGILSNDKVSNFDSSKVILESSVTQDPRLRGDDRIDRGNDKKGFMLYLVISFCILSFAFCVGQIHAQSASSQFTESLTTTGVIDNTSPSVPTNLNATAISQSEIDLVWSPSTDNVAVGGYVLFRDSLPIATTTLTSYADTLLTASTTYTYAVEAFDTSYNYSALSVAVSTSTLPIPIIPPTPTSTPTSTVPVIGQGGASSGSSLIYNVHTSADSGNAIISFLTTLPAQSTVSYGLTPDYEAGSISSVLYDTSHQVTLSGLAPETHYYVRITATAANGSQSSFITEFTTAGLPGTPLPNPSSFSATPTSNAIDLSWTNTTDPRATEVRIVRSETFFPSDQFDGVPIYEGPGQSFRDTSAVAGKTYYYAIFSEGTNGLFSSGALAKARIPLPGEVVSFATSSNPFSGITFVQNVNPMIAGLTMSDFEFIQEGKELSLTNNIIGVNGQENMTIRLPYNKVPQILKTIAVTLNDPTDPSKAFIFLLRANADQTYYEASIGPLGRTGIFPLTITILDYQNQGLKQLNGSLAALSIGAYPIVKGFNQTWLWIGLGLLIVLLIIAAMWKRRSKNRRLIIDSNKAAVVVAIIILGFSLSTFYFLLSTSSAHASFNPEINYQGKLANSSNIAVADGQYPIIFSLYSAASGGSAVWTETDYGANQVTVKNGLFSIMLGSTTPFTGIDFNQTYYLGVTVASDTEMTPRKIIGAVPAAFYSATSTYATNSGTSTISLSANTLQNLTPGQFFRSDIANSTSSATTSLSITQTGAGKIAEFFGSALQSVLALLSNGNVGIGSSTPSTALVVNGTATVGNLVSTTTATSTFGGGITANCFSTGSGCLSSGTNYFSNSGATTTLNTGSILTATNGTFGAINSTSSASITGITTTGGLSVASLSGLLFGTSGAVSATTSISNSYLTNSTISGISLGSNLTILSTNSTLSMAGGYNGSTTRTIGLNLGNANTWTGGQTFGNSTTTNLAITGLSNTILAVNSLGQVIGTTTGGVGTNYFSNSGATTTLTTGTNLAAALGVFGSVQATSTATSTFTGGISANCFSVNGGACLGSGGGSQTPWTSDIDGGGFNLTDVGVLSTQNNTLDDGSGNSVWPFVGNIGTTITIGADPNVEGFPAIYMTDSNGEPFFQVLDAGGGNGYGLMQLRDNSAGIGFTLAGTGLLDGNTNNPLLGWDGTTITLGNAGQPVVTTHNTLDDGSGNVYIGGALNADGGIDTGGAKIYTDGGGVDPYYLELDAGVSSSSMLSKLGQDKGFNKLGSLWMYYESTSSQLMAMVPTGPNTVEQYQIPMIDLGPFGSINPALLTASKGSVDALASTTASALSSLASVASTTDITLLSLSTQVQSLSTTLDAATANIASLASTTADLASTTANMASSTASVLTASQSFIQTISTAVQNMLQSTGNWVIAKLTATSVYANDIQTQTIEAQTASITNGLEMTDQATGQVYCVQIKNGDFAKTLGTCGAVASSTPVQELPLYSTSTTPNDQAPMINNQNNNQGSIINNQVNSTTTVISTSTTATSSQTFNVQLLTSTSTSMIATSTTDQVPISTSTSTPTMPSLPAPASSDTSATTSTASTDSTSVTTTAPAPTTAPTPSPTSDSSGSVSTAPAAGDSASVTPSVAN